MNRKPTLTRRAAINLLLAGTPVALVGCLSVRELDSIQAEWDRKHPEGTGIMGSRLPEMVRVIATFRATEAQRATALANARLAYQRMARQRSRQVTATSKPKRPTAPVSIIVPDGGTGKPVLGGSPEQTVAKAKEIVSATGKDVYVLPRFLNANVDSDARMERGAKPTLTVDALSSKTVGLVAVFNQPPKKESLVTINGLTSVHVGGS